MFVAALLLFQHIALPDLPSVQSNPYTSAADVEQGRKLYGGRCAGCHGPLGDGGKGTSLTMPVLPRAQTDLALYRVIRYGLPETEMPAHNMTQREIWQLSAYVRTLGRAGADSIPGDARRGALLVRGKAGCLQCHVLDGEGRDLGPSLTGIGGRRSPAYFRLKLMDPASDLPDFFSMVKLKTRDGKRVTGMRMNEDTWSIQVRDSNSGLHSFWKDELAELTVERSTIMPSYARQLTDDERNDIVAFLVQTGGRP